MRYSGIWIWHHNHNMIWQIQLDTARYVRIQRDTVGYSGVQVDLLQKQNGY